MVFSEKFQGEMMDLRLDGVFFFEKKKMGLGTSAQKLINIAPEKWWLEDDPASFWVKRPIFRGELLNFGRVTKSSQKR